MKSTKVTCAIILFNEKVLTVQRSESMSRPLKWEFPGGKIEQGETEEDCIKREIKEEINIDIELISRLTPCHFEYPDISIQLIPFLAHHKSGNIRLSEHAQYLLIPKDKLNELDWVEADITILKEYLSL